MNRSYSKIRHIQEANALLEKKILSEQVETTTSTETASTETATADTTQQPKEVDVQGKTKTEELVGTLQELLKNTYKQNIVVDKKYGPKTAQAILDALKTLKK